MLIKWARDVRAKKWGPPYYQDMQYVEYRAHFFQKRSAGFRNEQI